MAVTISGTQVTFNDGTVQTTEATLLGAVQYTAYSSQSRFGLQGYSTSEIDQPHSYGDVVSATSIPLTTVYCGVRGYRSGSTDSSDGPQDTGIIQSRILYRSVSGA
jgi:hypothetical protein